jgi:hypothetical protein
VGANYKSILNQEKGMNEFLIAFAGIAGLVAIALVGYQFFARKHRKENEFFARNNAEGAMRIKAKQYEEEPSYY